MNGAASQSARTGPAMARAAGRNVPTANAVMRAIVGLATMPLRKARRRAAPPGGAGRRRFPLEHLTARHTEAQERDANGVQPLRRFAGEERQLQRHTRRRCACILDRRANVRAPPQAGARAAPDLQERQDERHRHAPKRCRRPEPPRSPEAQSSRVRGGGASREEEAAPKVVQNLPASNQRKVIAHPALAGRHVGKATTESASRRGPSGAAAGRAPARSTDIRRSPRYR